jgi:hypothetical protein
VHTAGPRYRGPHPHLQANLSPFCSKHLPHLAGDVQQTSDLGDYRCVEGIKVPFRVTISDSMQVVTIGSSDLGPHLASLHFAQSGPRPVPEPQTASMPEAPPAGRLPPYSGWNGGSSGSVRLPTIRPRTINN